MSNYSILIAEDDVAYARQLSETFQAEGYSVILCKDGSEAIRSLREHSVGMGFIDLAMPGMDGMEVIERAAREVPHIPLVMITGYGSIDKAVQAVRLGAYDFIEKPAALDRLLLTAKNALEKHSLSQKTRWMAGEILEKYRMVGSSPAMREVYTLIDKVAPTSGTVLITGETGTGKELAAMAIHMRSPRADGPLVRVNCAAIPDTLIESELFGHKKGSFTHALEDKTGRFRQAHNGTMFLDEIGDMSGAAQAKMLRVLEQKEVEPLGDTRSYPVDVRIISATNKCIQDEIHKSRFREDLLYRLNTIEITIPPLREHRQDIPDLASYFIEQAGNKHNRCVTGIDERGMQLLIQHDWPGNVRELRSVIENLVILAEGEIITVHEVQKKLSHEDSDPGVAANYHDAMRVREKQLLEETLAATGWNVSEAARLLDICRTNLYKKMKQLGIPSRSLQHK